MERLCFTFEIRPGQEAEYKRRHDEIWPELVELMRASGISNYSLFRRGTQVVGYLECDPDVESALAAAGESELSRKWAESLVPEVIPRLTDEHGDLATFEEVWHLD